MASFGAHLAQIWPIWGTDLFMVKDPAIHVMCGQSSDCRAQRQLSESGSFEIVRDGLSTRGKLEHPKVAVAICMIAQSFRDGLQT